MMLKRLARRWNPEKALKGETKYHLFSARSFLTAMYGDAMVEEITEAWKKTSPVELEAYRTDIECNCGIEVLLGEDGRSFTKIRGDKMHPASQGYTCNKAELIPKR